MRLLFTALACLVYVSVFGQVWEQTYGETTHNEELSSIIQTLDGGFVSVGTKDGIEVYNSYIYFLKVNEFGIEQWSHFYALPFFVDEAVDFDYVLTNIHMKKSLSDDGYFITGSYQILSIPSGTELEEFFDITFLLKVDSYGVPEWHKTWNGPNALEVLLGVRFSCEGFDTTTDGGIILFCNKDYIDVASNNTIKELYLIKTDNYGLEEWNHTIPFPTEPEMNSGPDSGIRGGIQTSDEGYLIYGGSLWNEPSSGFLIKTDSSGNIQWNQTYSDLPDGYTSAQINSVQQTIDNGFIFCINYVNNTDIIYNTALIKTDINGVQEWSQLLQSNPVSGSCLALQMITDTFDGGYILTGWRIENINIPDLAHSDIPLMKVNSLGIEEWTQTFEGNGHGFLTPEPFVQQTIDEGYVISGSDWQGESLIFDQNGHYNALIIKTDSEGTLSSEFTIPTPSPQNLKKVVDALGREVNPTTNQILFHIYDDGSVEKKFVVE